MIVSIGFLYKILILSTFLKPFLCWQPPSSLLRCRQSSILHDYNHHHQHQQCTTTTQLFLKPQRPEDTDPVLQLPLMEAELLLLSEKKKDMITEDDKKRSTELTDAIKDAKTAAEFGIRRVQVDFYNAFTEQNLTAMENLWSSRDDIRCIHPGMSSLDGPEAVMSSWEEIFIGSPSFAIQPLNNASTFADRPHSVVVKKKHRTVEASNV
eukprot:CAMPEP_0194172988 /NCGR_PEP_ID=MMETSP0154-20130528/7380_1 /TAXON_ID=1049557 /ORGANISM="Thalassiothrix antarctica, Strain L6-D1" /LENGTH=208 /DNA_ID=CAMNT_0038885867 /DNA_START=59 /DNA_END=686 /DNA_ORIENTATION=-